MRSSIDLEAKLGMAPYATGNTVFSKNLAAKAMVEMADGQKYFLPP